MFAKKYWLYGILATFSLPGVGYTQPIVLESSAGESYIMDVSFDDSFHSVMQNIHQSFFLVEEQPISTHLQMTVLDNTVIVRAAVQNTPRDYNAVLDNEKAGNIAYVVKTLSNKGLKEIKDAKSSLKESEKKIERVHPLRFLEYIFTNQELIVCMRNFQGRFWVWGEFIDGLSGSLNEERKSNLLPFAQEFANRVHVDLNFLLPHLQSGKWEKLVDALIKHVPRDTSNSTRYDM